MYGLLTMARFCLFLKHVVLHYVPPNKTIRITWLIVRGPPIWGKNQGVHMGLSEELREPIKFDVLIMWRAHPILTEKRAAAEVQFTIQAP